MRIWLHSTVKSSAFSPGVAFSIATHAVLIGGAVIGTERAARSLLESVRESIVYLPPPDRTPSQHAVDERVRYVRVGTGMPLDGMAPGAQRRGDARSALDRGAERTGRDDVTQAAQPALDLSADSVYSVLDVDLQATRVDGSAAPIYPAELRERHVEGSVSGRYVIDSLGRAEPESFEVLSATHPEFVQAVRDALPGMRFSPAIIAGRRVRQMVEQRFAFRMAVTLPSTAAAEHTKAVAAP